MGKKKGLVYAGFMRMRYTTATIRGYKSDNPYKIDIMPNMSVPHILHSWCRVLLDVYLDLDSGVGELSDCYQCYA